MTPSEKKPAIPRLFAAILVLLTMAAMGAYALYLSMPKGEPPQIAGYREWPAEVLRTAASLPVQDGGRIKPLSALAGFTLYTLHGSRTVRIRDAAGKKNALDPVAWMLDTLFRPELAVKEPVFRVDNSAVLEAVGLRPGHRRDRYSYDDLKDGLEKLRAIANAASRTKPEKRDPLHRQIIELQENVATYEALLHAFDFGRNALHLDGESSAPVRVSDLMEPAAKASAEVMAARAGKREPEAGANTLCTLIIQIARGASGSPAFFPPADSADRQWNTAGDIIASPLQRTGANGAAAATGVKEIEDLCSALEESPAAFGSRLEALRNQTAARALARGEGKHLALETSYHRMDWFFKALLLFSAGVVAALAMWLAGRTRAGAILAKATFVLTAAGALLAAIAIAQRIIIMGRSPVGNLYDTIIFISFAATVLALVVEGFLRNRLALGLAPVLGASLVFLSRLFEVGDAKDHLDPLMAVLASNYWLTLHVITVTLGYAAGLLAAVLAAIYILMRGLRLDSGDETLRRKLTSAVYGMVCLTLFLSLVGTVLGGIWANDSWGRFWGWDPKENGALLIVIWCLAILHARLGGFLRQWGLHLATTFLAAVIAFSWWHVNFFNVGLHNYGFTTGVTVIHSFYAGVAVLIIFGFCAIAIEGRVRR